MDIATLERNVNGVGKPEDELLVKINALALDVLPDNFPELSPDNVYLQITTLKDAMPVAA